MQDAPVTTQQQVLSADVKAQIDEAMNRSLNLGKPQNIQAPNQPTQATTDPTNTVDNAATANPAAKPTQPDAATAAPDLFQPFKDKFGYAAPEDALREIEELRALKSNPPKPAHQFANEESKKLYEAWTKGETKKVYEYLNELNRIESIGTEVTPGNAESIVKTAMQLKYRNLSQDEINFLYKKQYTLPAQPKRLAEEEDQDYAQRLEDWKNVAKDKEMELMIAAKTSIPEIQSQKQNIVLPAIEPDQEYLAFKNESEQAQKAWAEATEAYKTFRPEMIANKLNFKDEANKVDFDFEYSPDQESFAQTIDMVSDIDKFFERYYDKDGNPDRVSFARAIYFATNAEKIIREAINQGKNAAIKALLPDNSRGGLVRQLVTNTPGELSELEKNMQRAGITR